MDETNLNQFGEAAPSGTFGRASGETSRIAFEGPGWVLIQPSEGPTVPPHARQG